MFGGNIVKKKNSTTTKKDFNYNNEQKIYTSKN